MIMATSKKKVAANRKNSARSTGPTTEAGKVRSAMNARTHGLLARDAVHPDFDSDNDCTEFDELARRNHAWYRPVGPIEEILLDKITIAIWRLRKALRYETACTSPGMYDDRPQVGLFGIYEGLGGSNLQRTVNEELKYQPLMAGANDEARAITPLSHQTALLLRYEAAANREMYRAMAELRRMRKEGPPRDDWQEREESALSAPEEAAPQASARADDLENCETKPNPESAPRKQAFSDSPETSAHPAQSGDESPSSDNRQSTSG
jgi:hypothetical protein